MESRFHISAGTAEKVSLDLKLNHKSKTLLLKHEFVHLFCANL